jgi:hypothetical protein
MAVVDVRSRGAAGDGTTDDRAAIMAAIPDREPGDRREFQGWAPPRRRSGQELRSALLGAQLVGLRNPPQPQRDRPAAHPRQPPQRCAGAVVRNIELRGNKSVNIVGNPAVSGNQWENNGFAHAAVRATVRGAAGQEIDGKPSLMRAPLGSADLQSDGSNRWIVQGSADGGEKRVPSSLILRCNLISPRKGK